VHDTKQLPLRIDLASRSQGESPQPVGVQVAEDRFDNPQALAVDQPATPAGRSGSSSRRYVGVRLLCLGAIEEGDLAIAAVLEILMYCNTLPLRLKPD
jgi:hypothetical protein